jgi:ribosomal protein L40E
MTDLLDLDEAEPVAQAADAGAGQKRKTNRQGFELGVCRVCGAEAPTDRATYCDEHKQARPKKGTARQAPETPAATESVKRPPRPGKGAPSGDEWSTKIFDKTVILLTALLAGSMVRRYELNDPDDAIADALTMTNDEARRVARPLGRFVAGTDLNKRYGRKVLDNSDLLDAGFALYDYVERVNSTLRGLQAQQRPLASVSPIIPIPEERPDYGTAESPVEQQQPGIPDPGAFPNITGAVYTP